MHCVTLEDWAATLMTNGNRLNAHVTPRINAIAEDWAQASFPKSQWKVSAGGACIAHAYQK
jgi:hypothetical protein